MILMGIDKYGGDIVSLSFPLGPLKRDTLGGHLRVTF